MKIKPMFVGIATFVPGVNRMVGRLAGGASASRYCYSVWLRHLVLAHDALGRKIPKIVAELGPGDSLGIGLAALLSGAESYYAFDAVKFANNNNNLRVFDELVELFSSRADIPGDNELDVKPILDSYVFPANILPAEHMAWALAPDRIARCRAAILNAETSSGIVRYLAPWFDATVIEPGTIDMMFSQAVLEHVDDIAGAYAAMRKWLKPNGIMTHTIDYRSHGLADQWNGHWTCSEFAWKLLRGKRPYLLNRLPHSTHVRLMQESGFRVLVDKHINTPNTLTSRHLAKRFRSMSFSDLTTSESFIVATQSSLGVTAL